MTIGRTDYTKCPDCGKKYKEDFGWEKHQARVHGWEPSSTGLRPTLEHQLWTAKIQVKELRKTVKKAGGNTNWVPR